MAKYIGCAKCRGTSGTMIRRGDQYEHARPSDCEKIRRAIRQRASILAARQPVKDKPLMPGIVEWIKRTPLRIKGVRHGQHDKRA